MLLVFVSHCLMSFVVTDCRLANQMQMLNYNDWMKLVTTLFANLLVILGHVRVFSANPLALAVAHYTKIATANKLLYRPVCKLEAKNIINGM